MIPKQVDGLEQALGHVNRATLLTHDLIYRFDGRDSGNSVPKEVVKHEMDQQAGREGTTEEQDLQGSDSDFVGSGSGMDEVMQAQKLAESLALNGSPIHIEARSKVGSRRSPTPFLSNNYKRSKIEKAGKKVSSKKKSSEKSSKKKEEKKESKSAAKKEKVEGKPASTNDDTTANTSSNSTSTADNSSSASDTSKKSDGVEDEVAKTVADKYFHEKPELGMAIKCKIPGKTGPMDGVLKFIGHIPNLPKRSSVIVAGLELSTDEDLGTDGTFLGKRYFTVPAKRGYFVPVKNCSPTNKRK